ncbi:MAG: D-glycero-D-manno-heptose 1-phosphate guanosyltransferase [Betaproteobacteria bacterium]|nr:MAG: D-glycero-D-manno-heptose 1-phosphate guanosyltransferase [Betaproteobacteria bacterium]
MEAIVLAGGLGTRLRGVVDDVPKPMAPVQGRPFLALVLDQLVAAGFKTVIFAAGYLHEAIRSYFGADYRGLVLRYSVEEEPLGTGGAIRLACEQADARDVFVLNGDTYLELDFRAMADVHVRSESPLSMAICHVPDVARYGALEVDNGIVRRFLEKGASGPGWINAGIYLLGPDLRARLRPQGAFSFEHDLLAPELSSIPPLAFRASGLFIDIGIPEDYARAQRIFSQGPLR